MLFEPALFGVVIKSLVLTFVLFCVLFVGTIYGAHQLRALHWPWLNTVIDFVAPVLSLMLVFVLGAPAAALFASLYQGHLAQRIEKKYYGEAASGGAPAASVLLVALRFLGLVIASSLALLPVDVALPVVGSVSTLAVNGWLLGREYFELEALRHMPLAEARAMAKRHVAGILGAGLVIAALAEVPLLDFIAPLIGVAFMVHVFKFYERREAG